MLSKHYKDIFTRPDLLPDHRVHTFKNGLRLVHKQVPHTAIAHCGFVIKAGSRDDGAKPGMAHCFEHMVFKGTKKRKPIHVLNRLEVVGGELNAFTTKEITSIYASIVDAYLERAVELLADITFNSVFADKELIKEKKVITEEINMYLDTPEENIFDEFQEQVFGKHALGPNILGTVDSLNSIKSSDLKSFRDHFYHPENMVLSVVANVPFEKVVKMAAKYCENYKTRSRPEPRKKFRTYKPSTHTKQADHVQAYAVMGNLAYNQYHKNREAMILLNNLLGGPGLNSRLNLSIREKYGFTYNVESGYTPLTDAGLFHCFLSTDKKYLDKSVSLIHKELKKLRDVKLTTLQLTQSKQQLIGQIIMAEESKMNLMLLLGRQLVQSEETESLEEVIRAIESTTAEQLQDIANEVFNPDDLSALYYLP